LREARRPEVRTELAGGFYAVDASHRAGELPVFRPCAFTEMGGYARVQVRSAPHMERRIGVAVEDVHAGRLRDVVENIVRQTGRDDGPIQEPGACALERLCAGIAPPDLRELPQHARVSETAVPVDAEKRMSRDQRVEVVAALAGEEPPRKLDRA
jgi:hypothetical protein